MNQIENSKVIRSKVVKVPEKKILISKLKNSLQEKDINLPVNCDGYGRIRHFKIHGHEDWVKDPLPNLPVAKALNTEPRDILKTQIFQIAGCNWNCWYCFVDEDLRCGDQSKSKWFTSDKLIELYKRDSLNLQCIVLSGGQPDLVPEWIFWMMKSLEKFNLEKKVFLWSDDNLSTSFYWKHLTKKQRDYISNYENYGKVCCFKGYDKKSFSFNTSTRPEFFSEQFKIFQRLLSENLDLYAYVTFTSQPIDEYDVLVKRFVDDLQKIHDNLPLRTVPLKIVIYQPMNKRLNYLNRKALEFQHIVLNSWVNELDNRFSKKELDKPICDVTLS